MSSVNSTHEPRKGMMRALYSLLPLGWMFSSNTTPGRAVQLADDHPLGAVDDERAQRGEHGKVTEVDLLFDDVLGTALVAHVLPDHQPERRLERSRVRHVALHALLHVVLGLAQRVPYEFQGEVPVDVRDGEDLVEDALQPHVLALARGRVGLKKRVERPQLHVEEVGMVHPRRQLGERDDRFIQRCQVGLPLSVRGYGKAQTTPTDCARRGGVPSVGI